MTGGKVIRTPDFQLAKLALYQLSYAPCELSILDCASRIANVREHTNLPAEDYSSKKATFFQPQHRRHQRFRQKLKPDGDLTNRHPAFVRFFERAKLRSCARKAVPACPYCPVAGTAKYAVNTPVIGSTALPVISPLLFM